MCAYGCSYADAIGPLGMGHIKCGTGYIVIGIHSIITVTYVGLGFDFIPNSERCLKSEHFEWDTILSEWDT